MEHTFQAAERADTCARRTGSRPVGAQAGGRMGNAGQGDNERASADRIHRIMVVCGLSMDQKGSAVGGRCGNEVRAEGPARGTGLAD